MSDEIKLSKRQKQLFFFLADGLSNREIAAALGISHRTAQVHRGHVMRKMQATTLADLIALCRTDNNKSRKQTGSTVSV